MTGIEAFLELLAASGVSHIFGNPGTTELPLNDALAGDDRFRYIFCLHEIPTVAAAEGYALASGSLGVANVHICCGLGNAMGMLYNAFRAGSPLLLTAGQQDRRLVFEEPVLAGDMVNVTRPWTKWSVEVNRVEDLPSAVRRAVQTARTPPTGPVFLSLPIDLQVESCGRLDLTPPRLAGRRVRPDVDDLCAAADLLLQSEHPAILAGSRVMESDGHRELVALAEHLGAPVFTEADTARGRQPFPTDHPLWQGSLPLWSAEVLERLADFDVLLVVGIDFLCQYIYSEPGRPIPAGARLVQIDEDAWEIGKNYPVDVALCADVKTTLAELDGMLSERQSEEQRSVAWKRISGYQQKQAEGREALLRQLEEARSSQPMTPFAAMQAIAEVLPADAAVVDEGVTSTQNLLQRLNVVRNPAAYFGHRGWALGWGIGCALGVKLAWPERPVVCFVGEGAALYGIQGLWTAAHARIPVLFVVCNNAQYRILKTCADRLPLSQMARKNYLGMDLANPEVDFVQLSKSFGVDAVRVESAEALREEVKLGLTYGGPYLLDVVMSR